MARSTFTCVASPKSNLANGVFVRATSWVTRKVSIFIGLIQAFSTSPAALVQTAPGISNRCPCSFAAMRSSMSILSRRKEPPSNSTDSSFWAVISAVQV